MNAQQEAESQLQRRFPRLRRNTEGKCNRRDFIETEHRLYQRDTRGFCDCASHHHFCASQRACEDCNKTYFEHQHADCARKRYLVQRRDLSTYMPSERRSVEEYPCHRGNAPALPFLRPVCVGLRDADVVCWERKV